MADENGNGKIKLDFKTIATIVSLLAMGGGLVASWATQKAALNELQRDYVTLQQEFKDYKEKTSETILNMKLDITSSSGDIRSIKEDVGEIKADVKQLLGR